MRRFLLSVSRTTKKFIVAFADFISLCLSVISAILVGDQNISEITFAGSLGLVWIPFFYVSVFSLSGVYRSVLRYIDFSVIYLILRSIFISFASVIFIKYITIFILAPNLSFISPTTIPITLIGSIVSLLMTICLIIGLRLWANYFFAEKIPEKRVVIYGAGSAGIQLAGALRVSKEIHPIAFLDKNPSLHNTFLGGIKVLDPKKLGKLISKNKVDEVLIAMPSSSKSSLRHLLKEIEEYSVKVRILPGLEALAQGKVSVSELKEVDISDLLGRVEVEANGELLDRNIKGKVVLITGAGGSIGSEIVRQVSKRSVKKIILLDSNEYSLYSIKEEIKISFPEVLIYALLGNVTNKRKMIEVMDVFNVDTIYHAAAYKHVPLVEENAFEGVINNILGTEACVKAAIDTNVETFVLISTDKAVRPTNIMGATKRFSEMILQSLDETSNTKMMMVRFGNVLGSSGSAIPLFQQQIRAGGPVTVTDPEVIRYFMSIPEAAELVIQAGAMGEGGDVFVLDMGEPVKIVEIAQRLIKLSGMDLKDETNPEGDIEIIFTGLRPGEKLYEELLIGDNVSPTAHKQILKAKEDFLSREDLEDYILKIKEAEKFYDVSSLKNILKEAIQEFTPEEKTTDIILLQKEIVNNP